MNKPILSAMLSCQKEYLTDEEKYLFSQYSPLGITLFERNIKNKSQLKKLVEDIKNTINRDDVLIAVDEEGGRVSRLRKIKKTTYISEEELGNKPKEYSKAHAELIAIDMRSLGINVNYAPVVDVKTRNEKGVLATRCFSKNKEEIVKYATTIADTYMDMSICPCIKHIPGHFSSSKDPHINELSTNLSQEKIEKEIKYLDFISHYPMAMTSHIKLNQIDKTNPTTISSNVISKIIRDYLKFDGFLISDAIDMHAISGSIVDKSNQSLNAGVDAICYCGGNINHLYAICKEQRFMAEKSLIRFANIKKIIHNKPRKVDVKLVKNFYQEGCKDAINQKYSYDATEVLHQMLKKGEII